MSFNAFGCLITGWKTIQIYAYLIILGETESLDEKRHHRMMELNLI